MESLNRKFRFWISVACEGLGALPFILLFILALALADAIDRPAHALDTTGMFPELDATIQRMNDQLGLPARQPPQPATLTAEQVEAIEQALRRIEANQRRVSTPGPMLRQGELTPAAPPAQPAPYTPE